MKSFNLFLLFLIVIALASSFSAKVFAADSNASINIACTSYHYPWCESKPSGIADLVGLFYKYALAVVGVAALGAIIYGGIKWAISGDPSGNQEARDLIMDAIYGLILLLSAYLILSTINPNLTKLTNPDIKPISTTSIQQ